MKKLIIFIILVNCLLLAYSQDKSLNQYSGNATSISELISLSKSNRYLKPSAITCQQLINNTWQTVQLSEITYTNQNISQVLTKSLFDNNLLPLSKINITWLNDRITEYKYYYNYAFTNNAINWQLVLQCNNSFNNLNHLETSIFGFSSVGSSNIYNYTYSNNILNEMKLKSINSDGSFSYEKGNYHYTNNRLDSLVTYSSLNDILYTLSKRSITTYRADDNSTYEDFQNSIDNSYLNSWSLLNNNNNTLVTQQLNQNYVNNSWVNNTRLSYEYNAQNLRSKQTEQIFESNQWKNQSVYEYTYSDNGNRLLTKTECLYSNNQITTQNKYNYEYNAPISNDEIVTAQSFNIATYPNPFTNDMTISLQAKKQASLIISLYNIKGQLISEKTSDINNPKSLNLSSLVDNRTLPCGIYLLKITDGTTQLNKKILKLK